MENLTERELLITELIALGASVREVADYVCRSERTISNQLQVIYDKIGIERRMNALSAWYYQAIIKVTIQDSLLEQTQKMTLNPNQPIYQA